MLQGYQIFDADAHGSINPRMWEDLPEPYRARRPRPVTIHDESRTFGNYTAGWLIEGSLEPHPAWSRARQQANTPAQCPGGVRRRQHNANIVRSAV